MYQDTFWADHIESVIGIYVCMYMIVCIYDCMCVCISVCVCVCAFVCIYIYIYILHIYIYMIKATTTSPTFWYSIPSGFACLCS